MAIVYTVTVSNRTDIRQGWRVACFGMPDRNSNSRAGYVHESTHRTEAAARKEAARVAGFWNARVL
jgi:hypothetical protein